MSSDKTTKEITNEISPTDVERMQINKEYFIEEGSIYQIIGQKLEENNLRYSDLIKKLDLDPQNGYKYLKGKLKMERDLAIRIMIAFDMSLDEIQDVLKRNQFAILYPRNKRDYIIITAIVGGYNLQETNELLSLNNEYQLS